MTPTSPPPSICFQQSLLSYGLCSTRASHTSPHAGPGGRRIPRPAASAADPEKNPTSSSCSYSCSSSSSSSFSSSYSRSCSCSSSSLFFIFVFMVIAFFQHNRGRCNTFRNRLDPFETRFGLKNDPFRTPKATRGTSPDLPGPAGEPGRSGERSPRPESTVS